MQETKIVNAVGRKCKWYEKLSKKIIKFPAGSYNLSDIFIYLKHKNKNVCYTRLNPKDFSDNLAEPKWISLTPDKALDEISNE